MPDNPSPEQRLFEVIRKAKGREAFGRPRLDMRVKAGIFGLKNFFANLKSLPARNPFASEKISSLYVKLEGMGLAAVNKALSVILTAAVFLLLYYALASKVRYARMEQSLLNTKFRVLRSKSSVETLKPLSVYLDQIKKRDIFSPAPAIESREPVIAPADLQERIGELAGGLQLKGISWGEHPKTMIMNTGENKMYFLSEGQAIGTSGLEVREIQRSKVIITDGREEMELE